MNLVDKLLNIDKEKAQKEIKGTFESVRMKELVGDGTIEIKSVKERKAKRYATMGIDANGGMNPDGIMDGSLLLLVEGITNPDLKNEKLQRHFGAETPKDLAEILFDGEVQEISDAILGLTTVENEIEKVKN